VVSVGAIVLAGQHATALETEGQTHKGMDHFAQVSQGVLCPH